MKYRTKSYTATLWKLEFDQYLENNSLAGTTYLDKWTGLSSFMEDSNNIDTLYLKCINSSNLAISTVYTDTTKVNCTMNRPITNEYYLVFSLNADDLQGTKTAGEIVEAQLSFYFYDVSMDSYQLKIYYTHYNDMCKWRILGPGGDLVQPQLIVGYSEEDFWQVSLQTLLDICSSSVKFKKLYLTEYSLSYTTDTTIADVHEAIMMVRSAFLNLDQVHIKDVPINGTSISFPAESNVYSTRNISKIADVAVPFQFSSDASYLYDDEICSVTYSFDFLLPVASNLVFSGAKANFTVPDGTVESLTVNEADYLIKVKYKDPGDIILLLSSITTGSMYLIVTNTKYTEDQYYEVAMEVSIAWFSPAGIADKILGLIIAILNVIGFKGARLKKMRATIRTPKD